MSHSYDQKALDYGRIMYTINRAIKTIELNSYCLRAIREERQISFGFRFP